MAVVPILSDSHRPKDSGIPITAAETLTETKVIEAMSIISIYWQIKSANLKRNVVLWIIVKTLSTVLTL